MTKGRLEAFSDGVLAIVITIMVLELKVPHGADLGALLSLGPVFLAYVLSFVYVGLYWNNHHHMFHAVKRIDGAVLWANLHLLFWLSLFPFATAWMDENDFERLPVAVYGGVLFCAAIAYRILVETLRRRHGPETAFARAIGNDRKGTASVVLYLVAIPLAFVFPWGSLALYVGVAILWLIPDRRFSRVLNETEGEGHD